MSILDAKIGQRAGFIYHRGSKPGMYREVTVVSVDDDRITARECSTETPKQYLEMFISDVSLFTMPVTPPRFKVEDMLWSEAKQKLHDAIDELSGEDLAEALADIQGADSGSFDSSNGMVTLSSEVVPSAFYINAGETITTLVVKNGDEELEIELDNVLDMVTVDGIGVTPESLCDALKSHLDI